MHNRLLIPSAGAASAARSQTSELLDDFAADLQQTIEAVSDRSCLGRDDPAGPGLVPITLSDDAAFNAVALRLARLQFDANPVVRRLWSARGLTPGRIEHWKNIPAVPTSVFKDLDVSCIPEGKRATVFHSSGTTEQRPSRHFHHERSLALYERSLLKWFEAGASPGLRGRRFLFLTPGPGEAPNSSLVHMFETIRRSLADAGSEFAGSVGPDKAWSVSLETASRAFANAVTASDPLVVMGTAFSFVHLLDMLADAGLRFALPHGSVAMETGGYKGRSRSLPKASLHQLISEFLGIPSGKIFCEYGMSELSSQAYSKGGAGAFHFPQWARAEIISPEDGRGVADGGTGLLRIVDLANVYSVLAVQTEDLAIRRGDGFELLGRAAAAEPRGCSLMTAEDRSDL